MLVLVTGCSSSKLRKLTSADAAMRNDEEKRMSSRPDASLSSEALPTSTWVICLFDDISEACLLAMRQCQCDGDPISSVGVDHPQPMRPESRAYLGGGAGGHAVMAEWLQIFNQIFIQVHCRFTACIFCKLCYLVTSFQQPGYLADLISPYSQSRSLRSSTHKFLSVPPHNLDTAARRFSVAAPRLWNSLPLNYRTAPSVNTFKIRLKTFLFVSA